MNLNTQKFYNFIIRKFRLFKGFLSVSIAPILISKLEHSNYRILNPSNAFEEEILKYRRNIGKKENYAVFFARLAPEKGLFELPLIWREVAKIKPDFKLVVCGIPTRKYLIEKFKTLVKKFNIEDNILIKGYLQKSELFDIVSKSKVFVYPTHSDSFSLVTLESLAVGTPVVAYDIPAIRYVYSVTEAVKIVKEGNIREMISNILKIIELDEENYLNMINNDKLLSFLETYSSWDNVVKAEIEEFKNILSAS